MNDVARRRLASLAIVLCGAGGAIGWLAFVERNVIPFYMQDWIVQYAAGTAARGGQLALLYDSQRFTDFQAALLPSWMAAPPSLHPWLYPPPFLLLLAPLSRLPFAAGYAVFILPPLAATVTALAWRDGGWDWSRAAMMLFFPATLIDLLTGQNALLSAALMIGGLRLLDRWPRGRRAARPARLQAATLPAGAGGPCGGAGVARARRVDAGRRRCVLASAALFGLPAWRLWFHRRRPRRGSGAMPRGSPRRSCAATASLSRRCSRAFRTWPRAPCRRAGMAAGAVGCGSLPPLTRGGQRASPCCSRRRSRRRRTFSPTTWCCSPRAAILLWPRDGIGPGEFVLFARCGRCRSSAPIMGRRGASRCPWCCSRCCTTPARQRWQSTLFARAERHHQQAIARAFGVEREALHLVELGAAPRREPRARQDPVGDHRRVFDGAVGRAEAGDARHPDPARTSRSCCRARHWQRSRGRARREAARGARAAAVPNRRGSPRRAAAAPRRGAAVPRAGRDGRRLRLRRWTRWRHGAGRGGDASGDVAALAGARRPLGRLDVADRERRGAVVHGARGTSGTTLSSPLWPQMH